MFVFAISTDAHATIRYSVASGNWNSTATWAATSAGTAGASVPTSADSVVIENAFTVAVDTNSSCVYLRIIPKTTANIVTQLSIGAFTLTVGSGGMHIDGANNVIRLAKVLYTSAAGIITINGNLAIGDGLGTAATAVLDMSNAVNLACTLNVAGSITRNTTDGQFVPGTASVVNYNGSSAAQTIDMTNLTFAHLNINNTDSAVLNAAITTSNLSGNINVGSGIFKTNNFNIGMNNSTTLTVAASATMDAGTSVVTMGTSATVNINGTFKTSNSNGFQGAAGSAISSNNNPSINLGANSSVNLTGTTVSLSAGTYSSVDLNTGGTFTATGAQVISGSLNISNGTFVGGAFTHKIRGNWNMSGGTFVNTGTTIELDGSAVQTISSTGAFSNLTVNTTADSVVLGSDITVDGTLGLSSGKVSINTRVLTIGTAGSISGYGSTKYIICDNNGTLDQRVINGNSKLFPIGHPTGYFPATVGLTAGSSSDYFKVRIINVLRQQGSSGNPVTSDAVDVTWFISESVIGNSDATITLTWPAGMELSGFNRSACRIGHWTAGAWDYGSSDLVASGTDPYSVSSSGFTSFSPFSVAENGVLPVKWSYAKVQNLGNDNKVLWGTASEFNNDRFEIEASEDGVNFTVVGTIKAGGNSMAEQHYAFIHHAVNSSVTYYRIRQVDFDGHFEYSEMMLVKSGRNEILLYPNPAKDQLTLLNGTDGSIAAISDAQGKEIFSVTFENNKATADLSSLPMGIYFVRYFNGSEINVTRFVKIQD